MASFHVRSISLPKNSHPLTLAVEDQLCQLKASSSICQNLSGLQKLYECVEDFLSTQDGKCLDTVLDGSIMLLDVCSIIKDVLSQMRQSVQELQSSIRRRSNEVCEYMTSRKKITKVELIKRDERERKREKKKKKVDTEVSMLKEVEITTLAVLESVLSFVSAPKQNKSLISKLTLTKRVACNEETSEVMEVDTAVKALTKGIEVNNVQKTLKALEMTLQDLEDGLETVFRCLIKHRVSLLNINYLPTNSHPLTLAVEEQLCQLKATSSSSICQNLSGLQKLYECVEDFLSTQDGKCLDTVLDGSIMLLDVCSIIKDVLSQMRQSIQDLQSSIRRRSNEVSEYMISSKKITKVIRKCLANLKNNKKNNTEFCLLAEVEATTLAVFESILSFVSVPKQNKSLISKLTITKRVAHTEETSEVMKVENMVKSLTKGIEVKNAQKTLGSLEITLQDLEDGLETVFRCLIKHRVSLLNINYLPTNTHPLTLAVEEQLCQLKSSSSICQNLSCLQKLYECVEDFLSTQDGKCLDTVLDGSIMLLDVCSIIKDVLSQMRQSVQELQSSIRRRSNEVSEYMISRKKITKVIRKCLADLKNNKKNDTEISLLAEVEATTLAVFESILSFVSAPKENKSLISKLTLTKRIAHSEETSEVMKVDIAVKALTKGIEVNNVQKTLGALEMTLQDLEDGLETVFRCLIKHRVSLLNIN
ncbi:hypothetical protein MKW92_032353 [Papaver armeniacum]|nr:hypothetical protein MKW92_032353 [Papaver armeniacum]